MKNKIPLYDFQKKALEWAKPRNRIAIYMEMRLGKTRVAVAWANAHGAENILVVAPLTVLGSWQEELALLNEPSPNILRTHTPPSAHAKWSLTNYEALRANPSILHQRWDAVMLDESTRIKNPKAQITRILNGGRVERKRGETIVREHYEGCDAYLRAVLSGLPAPEGPMDYYEQFRFLYGGFCGCRNFWSFRDILFTPVGEGWDWVPKAGTRERIKREVHEKAFVLSRKQAGIGEHKVYETRKVSMSVELRKAYVKAEKEFCLDFPTMDGPRETNWPMVMNVWLGRMAGGFIDETLVDQAKLNELFVLLQGELLEEPVVVWCRFTAEILEIKARCEREGISVRAIVGATALADRNAYRHELNKGRTRVLVCQIKCARYGIDLSAADTAIYFSNSYSLEERMQSEDRIVHPAKATPLLLVDLVTEDTVDEDVVGALRKKHTESKFFLSDLADNFRRRMLSHASKRPQRTNGTGPGRTPVRNNTGRVKARVVGRRN